MMVEPGLLTDRARRAATQAALPLLATYFESGDPTRLSESRAVGEDELTEEAMAWAIRLRVALAAARRAEAVLRAVAVHPSFRYSRVNEETVGAVKGRLDLERYIKQRARRDVPQRYPVRVVRRSLATPENALLVWAVGTVAAMLREAPATAVPRNSAEAAELHERLSTLTRTMHNPLFEGAIRDASDVARRDEVDDLIEVVSDRLDSARVANVDAYRELLRFVGDLRRPFAGAGARSTWLGYDERFDSKLYEIWMLHQLLGALTRALGAPDAGPQPLTTRGKAPTASWRLGPLTLHLHFQISLLNAHAAGTVWRYQPKGTPLAGYVDTACIIDGGPLGRAAVLIDAKLRQRTGPPSEELYKLLGYFENLAELDYPSGAIVYYSPDAIVSRGLARAGGGQALLLGVDPEQPNDSVRCFDELVELILQTGETIAANVRSAPQLVGVTDGEDRVALVQELAVQALEDRARELPASELEPASRQLQATLGTAWTRLESDVQRMLTTAVYFGFRSQAEFDHSGPLLGLCAACERLLTHRVMAPLQAAVGHAYVRYTTIGAAAYWTMHAALLDREGAQEIRAWLLAPDREFDGPQFVALSTLLTDVKLDRNDAAHITLIDADRFATGYQRILDPAAGLLAKLVAALRL
jgi:hypothetical protein